jgi:2-oxoglutarate ferredoxin oxidoreductase subunit beta
MSTYGLHGIHGRAVAIASGLAMSREDLSVWVVTGDGDALSIGGNHLIHALRRNIEIKILMFNNEIYGLTKGQASPTSERGKITKSTPHGSLDPSFNPISVALGTEATFVARTLAPDREALTEILRRAANHRGSAFVEIYQNCTIFNDGAFDSLTSPEGRLANQIRLEHGKPIRFGRNNEKGVVVTPDAAVEIVDVAEVGEGNLLIHDEHAQKPNLAFSLSRLAGGPNQPTPLGIFWDVERPSYGEMMRAQIEAVRARGGPADLESLWISGDTWTVE